MAPPRPSSAPCSVSCNVQWTLVSDPLSQPMSARLLAGFLHSHFQDNLCTVSHDYEYAELSFANLGVREQVRVLVERGCSASRSGWSVQLQTSYRQFWPPYTSRGKGCSADRTTSSVLAA